MPEFMSGKRRAVILAAAGVLTVTSAVSATAASLPSTAAAASSSVTKTPTSPLTGTTMDALTSNFAATDLNLEKANAASIAAKAAQQKAAAQRAQQQQAAQRAHAIYLNRVAQQRAAAQQAAAQRQAQQQAAQQQQAQQQAAAQASASASQSQSSTSTSTSQGASSGSVSDSGSPQQIAQGMLASYGWSGQFSCLDSLWQQESDWSVTASNPGSGAYGIPQALPGSKMASAGADWQTNAATQITWGLQYIQSTYGSPCAAWSHEEADGWY
jgi:hypothetical protein